MAKVDCPKLRMIGVELYADDLGRAKKFYRETLGLKLTDEAPGYFAQFEAGNGFLCVERKGSESYPSRDKAVIFFEVPNLVRAIAAFGRDHIVGSDLTGVGRRPPWAVLHDPEGHNILLLEARNPRSSKARAYRNS